MQQAQIDRLRSAAVPAQQLFVGGQPTTAISEARLDVVSPIDGQVLTTTADGGPADIDLAVKRARQAFDDAYTDFKTAWIAL
jgi:gamma-glutamyl-gamma-aminobutyraldehyde dehydrogenase